MQFIRDMVKARDEALLSMDRDKILAYAKQYSPELLRSFKDDNLFWISVHKARTACRSLPIEERLKSKTWLEERGYRSFDPDL